MRNKDLGRVAVGLPPGFAATEESGVALQWLHSRQVKFNELELVRPILQEFEECARTFSVWAHQNRLGTGQAPRAGRPGRRRAPGMIYEAMECLGDAGHVEEGAVALLYREAPHNSIWEGSGKVICLDVLRTLPRDPDAREALTAGLDGATGLDSDYDRAPGAAREPWPGAVPEARCFTEPIAGPLAASMPPGAGPAAAACVPRRLDGAGWRSAGVSPAALDRVAVLARPGTAP